MLPQFPSHVMSPVPEASCADSDPCRAGKLTAEPRRCRTSRSPGDPHLPPRNKALCRLGSLLLNSDPCPCGVISRWALSSMSGHSMSHVWLLPTDCPGRSRHLNVLSKHWCAPGAAWPCYSCLGRMRFGGNGINKAARRELTPNRRTDFFFLKCWGRLPSRNSGSLMLMARFQL